MKNLLRRLALLALPVTLALASPSPVGAQEFYVTGSVGGFGSSDSNIQKVYGLMPVFKAGGGMEFDGGWGAELDLISAFKKGSLDKFFSNPAYSGNIGLMDLEVAARGFKSFGIRGKDIRPYVGLQLSYDYLAEKGTITHNGKDFASASGSASGFGAGIFGGADITLFKNFLLYAEAMFNYTHVNAKSDSNSAVAKSGVNTGGFSAGIGVKYFF